MNTDCELNNKLVMLMYHLLVKHSYATYLLPFLGHTCGLFPLSTVPLKNMSLKLERL